MAGSVDFVALARAYLFGGGLCDWSARGLGTPYDYATGEQSGVYANFETIKGEKIYERYLLAVD